jgi:hypothetical protein
VCGFLATSAAQAKPRGKASLAKKSDKEKAAELLRDYRSDLVLVEGKSESGGSGFITHINGRKYLVSNAHVLAGIKAVSMTLLDRTQLKVGPPMIAVGHDLVALPVDEGGAGIPSAESVETEAEVGDAVVVFGNPGARGVVTVVIGELIGIGPNRIEVSALIEHGNSGGPIIHLASGKVIGVATYAKTDELLAGGKKLRRFGYRLDSVRKWQAVDWSSFYAQADQMEKVERTSRELKQAHREIQLGSGYGRRGRTYSYDSPEIRRALDNYYAAMAQSQREPNVAAKVLLQALRAANRNGVATAKANLTYDYFLRQLEQHKAERNQLIENLDRALLR